MIENIDVILKMTNLVVKHRVVYDLIEEDGRGWEAECTQSEQFVRVVGKKRVDDAGLRRHAKDEHETKRMRITAEY